MPLCQPFTQTLLNETDQSIPLCHGHRPSVVPFRYMQRSLSYRRVTTRRKFLAKIASPAAKPGNDNDDLDDVNSFEG